MTDSSEENISIFLVFFAALLAFILVLSKYLHDRPVLSSVVPEAAMVLGVGMCAGFFVHLIFRKAFQLKEENADDDYGDEYDVDSELRALLSFSPEIFFIALLPPIIFNSGLRVGTLFFRHIAPIVMFAIMGTTISSVTVALLLKLVVNKGWVTGGFTPTLTELLTFGALISSTDPVSTLAVFQAKKVDPQLFYLVFGESVLNDALAIVLFKTLSTFVGKEHDAGTIALGLGEFALDLFFNSVGSCVLGVVSGLGTACLFKQIDMRQNRLVEISLYLLLMYIPFLLAEILHLSGIVTILFTGISANRYVVPNLSAITKVNADMLFRLLAHLAEMSIFLELGLSVFGLIGHWNWSFIGWSLLALFLSRALNIYPLAFTFNHILASNSAMATPFNQEEPTDQIIQFRRNPSGLETLNESLDPSRQKEADNHIVVLNRTQSFNTTISEQTATPYLKKDMKIRRNTMHMMWFCGLRGAVSYACARMYPDQSANKNEFIMTTMALVLITMMLFGGTTEFALSFLNIRIGVDEEQYMRKRLREPVLSSAIMNFDHNIIKTRVIRDYQVMHGFRDAHHERDETLGRRAQTAEQPKIELTESGYLGTVDEAQIATHRQQLDTGFEKLACQDSLFDYGAR